MSRLRWERLEEPPEYVTKVRDSSGTVWKRMDLYYWSGPGWEAGVAWSVLLRWSDLEEVRSDD